MLSVGVLAGCKNIYGAISRHMISQLNFETTRLSVENWQAILCEPFKRTRLERELEHILTPQITFRLPLSMQFSLGRDSISKWVDDVATEAQVLCVYECETAALAGLIILFYNPEEAELPTIHLGYLLGEAFWGKGYATEMVRALVTELRKGPPMRLAAGVDADNVASSRVLTKSGFEELPDQTTPGRLFFEMSLN